MTDLHQGVYLADLLIAALDANLDKPAVHIGDEVLTGAQMRDEISRYAQALAGARHHARAARCRCFRPTGPRSSSTWARRW